jgi:shikimate kinase
MNVYLTGYRCTGKTTIAALLAEHLKWTSVDADDMLVEDAGSPVSDIVAEKGWDVFRAMEKATLERISRMDGVVVSTGGGVILNDDNVTCMKKTGIVIWLKATPETIHNRMTGDGKTEEQRPSLTNKGVYDEIEDVLNQRTPLYEQAMDFSVETDNKDITEIRDIIIKELSCREIP